MTPSPPGFRPNRARNPPETAQARAAFRCARCGLPGSRPRTSRRMPRSGRAAPAAGSGARYRRGRRRTAVRRRGSRRCSRVFGRCSSGWNRSHRARRRARRSANRSSTRPMPHDADSGSAFRRPAAARRPARSHAPRGPARRRGPGPTCPSCRCDNRRRAALPRALRRRGSAGSCVGDRWPRCCCRCRCGASRGWGCI